MLAQLVNVLYTAVDRMFIGNIPDVGDIALAGIGVCAPLAEFLASWGNLIGVGGSVYMDAPIVEEKMVEQPKPVQTEAPKTMKPAPTGDARATFGLFLRSIRKTAKNGVLIALCMDLDSAYEDGIFVLYTNSDTVYRSLKKQDHFALIEQAFAAIGIATDGFDIRLKGKKADAFNAGVSEIQDTFGGIGINTDRI